MPMTSDEVAKRLHVIYQDLEKEIEQAGPVCDLSGRCCRFQEWDHTLFLSGIEAEILIREAPPSVRELDSGATCPWQDDRGRCTAREARPLGCRVYFCDPSYEGKAEALSEVYLARIKHLADESDRPWSYAPLHQHLRAAEERGTWCRFSPTQLESPPLTP